jgi:hypothetical protein
MSRGGWARALLLLAALATPAAVTAQETASPHGALPEGLSCSSCHSTEGWSPLRADLEFEHGRDADDVLDGRHAAASCTGCHESLVFSVAPASADGCAGCHVDVHVGTASRPCAACHTTTSFTDMPPGVVHPADFPLVGAHLQTTCEGCHVDDLGGAFSPLDTECASCHMGEYLAAPLIDHQALGFSTDCTECHSFLDFRDVPFDHLELSGGFELVGAHAGVECTSCHSLPGGGVPTAPAGPGDCIACHLDDYQHEHGGSGFPTDCLQCHSVFDWEAAEFDHAATTGFELIPGHDLLCIECHVGSTAQTIHAPQGPEDCYACHTLDYDSEHAGTGFSTDCRECHGTTTWEGASFDHDFPIRTGPHAGGDCVDCHLLPGDFDAFSCVTCHEHAQTDMDEKHRQEAGYVYESGACLSCHPDGRS